MRVRLSEWASAVYSHTSRPSENTLRAMAKRGDIPGAFQDTSKRWWVDVPERPVPEDAQDKARTAETLARYPELKKYVS